MTPARATAVATTPAAATATDATRRSRAPRTSRRTPASRSSRARTATAARPGTRHPGCVAMGLGSRGRSRSRSRVGRSSPGRLPGRPAEHHVDPRLPGRARRAGFRCPSPDGSGRSDRRQHEDVDESRQSVQPTRTEQDVSDDAVVDGRDVRQRRQWRRRTPEGVGEIGYAAVVGEGTGVSVGVVRRYSPPKANSV
jgi:hypothetical protein